MSGDAQIRLILVVDDDPAHPGGVELENRAVSDHAASLGVDVLAVPQSSVLPRILDAGSGVRTIVLAQSSGLLDRAWRNDSRRWLAAGAAVFEKNVFSNASRFRPRHPSYTMLLMSVDGLARYSLRSFLVGRSQQKIAILPNPIVVSSNPRPVRPVATSESRITFARVGRPDPTKWTTFEVDFACALKRAHPELAVRLLRMEAPRNWISQRDPGIELVDLPYSPDVGSVYAQADVYLHCSAIGETYGNTIAEAIRAGLPVINAMSLREDCGSIEVLDPRCDVTGTPAALLSDPVGALTKIRAAAGSPRLVPDYANFSVEEYWQALAALADGSGAPPSAALGIAASYRVLAREAATLSLRKQDALVVTIAEILRGVRRRWGQGGRQRPWRSEH